MTVYVDSAEHPFGRLRMCHMIADAPAELFAMAGLIGVDAKWFQDRASAPHFDIAKSKRALAVAAGAVALDRRRFVEEMRRIRAAWPVDEQNRWGRSPPGVA